MRSLFIVGDWPYPFQYVNASVDELAPTHRNQYMMVRKYKSKEMSQRETGPKSPYAQVEQVPEKTDFLDI